MIAAVTIVAGLSLAAWIYLLLFRGGFWPVNGTGRGAPRKEGDGN